MGHQTPQAARVWRLASRQHGVVSRRQLLELGFSAQAIKHRVATGRLHQVARGVYAVGRPDLGREGRWMVAVLACGADALLSHTSAAALWEIGEERRDGIELSVPSPGDRRRPGLIVHRRGPGELARCARRLIPVTTPLQTLLDLSTCLSLAALETAVIEADKRSLVSPERLREAVAAGAGRRGAPLLRAVLHQDSYAVTDSTLERRFLALARRAGLPKPLTQVRLDGHRVDFYWPELGLVVETDGLRYHRTAAQQAKDRRRDQAHTAAGRTVLRFTHAQVVREAAATVSTLVAVARRCGVR
jgi:very-short-patch-repair endonuclease